MLGGSIRVSKRHWVLAAAAAAAAGGGSGGCAAGSSAGQGVGGEEVCSLAWGGGGAGPLPWPRGAGAVQLGVGVGGWGWGSGCCPLQQLQQLLVLLLQLRGGSLLPWGGVQVRWRGRHAEVRLAALPLHWLRVLLRCRLRLGWGWQGCCCCCCCCWGWRRRLCLEDAEGKGWVDVPPCCSSSSSTGLVHCLCCCCSSWLRSGCAALTEGLVKVQAGLPDGHRDEHCSSSAQVRDVGQGGGREAWHKGGGLEVQREAAAVCQAATTPAS